MSEPPLILVVDDDDRIIQLLQTFFDISGFSVETAMDSVSATERLEDTLPDAMILDVMLPDTDGISFCRQIRAHTGWEKLPIIMFSAKSDKEDIKNAMDAGATKYISKPASLKFILSTIREVLALPPEPLQALLDDENLIEGDSVTHT